MPTREMCMVGYQIKSLRDPHHSKKANGDDKRMSKEASEKPVAFVLRMLLSGIDGVLRCYIKNYPAEKCEKCSFRWMCGSLYNLREAQRTTETD